MLGFARAAPDARWMRDHDGLQIGPELISRDGVLVVSCQGRGAVGLSAATGREVWRLLPPRTQRTWVSVSGHRVLVADDGGHLHGLDLQTGRVRFRTRAPLPFTGPALPWGTRLLGTLGRGSHGALCAFDAHSGGILWTHEFPFGNVSEPVVASRRIYVSAGDAREETLLCLDFRGRTAWDRRLHLGEAPGSLSTDGTSVRVWARNGALASFSLEGAPQWRVGASGHELPCNLQAFESRGVLLVPGEVTRAVDPRGGRVLAELRTGLGLCDLVADSKLALYALDEDGTLTAWTLGTTLAIV
jgi:outer membrane protein assembly factor BamB